MKDIYARQIPPEYQESPLFWGDEFFPDNVILTGNRDFNEHTTALYDRILCDYDNAAEDLDDLENNRESWRDWKNATEIIEYYFPAMEYRGRPYSTQAIHAIRNALHLFGTDRYYRGGYLIDTMEAITGKPWKKKTLRGLCQGDWIECYYSPDDYTPDALEHLEIEYFNTGSEWIIHDGDNVPASAEDVEGYCMYCHGWNLETIAREIADAAGSDPDHVHLYEFDTFRQVPTWKGARLA